MFKPAIIGSSIACITILLLAAASPVTGETSGSASGQASGGGGGGGGAVFQYQTTYTYMDKDKEREVTAFLWVPPLAERVRGVIIAGQTLMERDFVQDAVIREACAADGLAIIYLTGGLGTLDVEAVLPAFAAKSGYAELAVSPLMFVGHSAGGPQAYDKARRYADRCFGLVQYRGGAPIWGDKHLPPSIPALMMIGQFDEFGGQMRDEAGKESWEDPVGAMVSFRKADTGNLGNAVVEPGAGHFAWSDRNAAYLAMWITKAAQARLPQTPPADPTQAPTLQTIDPTSGYLTDHNLRDPQHAPAAYADYTGDKQAAAWHVDQAMAEATAAYHEGLAGRADQFLKWNDRFWVDAGARYFFMGMTWVDDGQTFAVHPAYRDTYPATDPAGGPRWTQAGEPVGNSGTPIKVKKVSGPIRPVGEHKFRMTFDNLNPAGSQDRVTFMAYSEGDDKHRYTEHVGMMPRGFKGLDRGKGQTLSFPQLDDIKVGSQPVELKATSDAGLKVEYYVAVGPAAVVDGKLIIKDLPARATYPIQVKVVAHQFGSGVEPQVKTATPVSQTLHIQKE